MDLVLAEALAYRIDQLIEVMKELFDCHEGFGNSRVEPLAGAALLPIHDRETLLQRCIEVTQRRISGKPGPPCTKINSGLSTLTPRIITN